MEIREGLNFFARARNLEIVSAAGFNEKLRDYGAPKYVTVQKVSRYAKDERQVRDAMTKIWNGPENSKNTLQQLNKENVELFEFEKKLEN